MTRRFDTLQDVADELRTIDQGDRSLAYPWGYLAQRVSMPAEDGGWKFRPQFDPDHADYSAHLFWLLFDQFDPDNADDES